MGPVGVEPTTLPLSGVRSNRLSYEPVLWPAPGQSRPRATVSLAPGDFQKARPPLAGDRRGGIKKATADWLVAWACVPRTSAGHPQPSDASRVLLSFVPSTSLRLQPLVQLLYRRSRLSTTIIAFAEAQSIDFSHKVKKIFRATCCAASTAAFRAHSAARDDLPA